MDITMRHIHTIEFGDSVMIVLILALAVVAFCTLYPMMLTPSLTLEAPKAPMGFQKR